jgi:hypothetical protein
VLLTFLDAREGVRPGATVDHNGVQDAHTELVEVDSGAIGLPTVHLIATFKRID